MAVFIAANITVGDELVSVETLGHLLAHVDACHLRTARAEIALGSMNDALFHDLVEELQTPWTEAGLPVNPHLAGEHTGHVVSIHRTADLHMSGLLADDASVTFDVRGDVAHEK